MAKRQALSPPVLPGYTYVRPLGSGGFADVFLFQQDMPRRLVAVKVLLSRIEDEAAAAALASEADVMAQLSAHPSILTVYQAGVSADGRPFLVSEYCPASLTNRYRNERMPVAEVLSIGIKIASAIETAHRAGLLHRDIKPSNILLTSFGHPVLSDFGVASALEQGEDDVIAMSPPWSAPEVVDHKTSGSVATEVWALAATVYTLLAQHSPFDIPGQRRNDADLIKRIGKAKYVDIDRSDVPDVLQRALEGGMRKLPGDRYPTAQAFGHALQQVEMEMGLPVTALEIPKDEWSQSAVPMPEAGEQRQAVRSTVPVQSQRLRRDADAHTRAGTSTMRARRAGKVGRSIAVGAAIGGAAVVGVVVTILVVVGA
ncbi:serine/threonine protein kinase [Demequina sp. B12]|uniref:serine/threonine-protein kinase n=1 Tax=Demequina sp. B12 TaxID=2992757 RepID=UPI00237A8C21|nr:serine/threonine-protein kinase [Demequina sp. B12]MDE0572065.1 serine/threonine protein kinase [Demequina sp. B12]